MQEQRDGLTLCHGRVRELARVGRVHVHVVHGVNVVTRQRVERLKPLVGQAQQLQLGAGLPPERVDTGASPLATSATLGDPLPWRHHPVGRSNGACNLGVGQHVPETRRRLLSVGVVNGRLAGSRVFLWCDAVGPHVSGQLGVLRPVPHVCCRRRRDLPDAVVIHAGDGSGMLTVVLRTGCSGGLAAIGIMASSSVCSGTIGTVPRPVVVD